MHFCVVKIHSKEQTLPKNEDCNDNEEQEDDNIENALNSTMVMTNRFYDLCHSQSNLKMIFSVDSNRRVSVSNGPKSISHVIIIIINKV